MVVIDITDGGPGIAPDRLEAIFDPFYTTKAPGEGTGLGLSLARKLVELHYGAISAANREDSTGLCVSIILPTNASMRTSV